MGYLYKEEKNKQLRNIYMCVLVCARDKVAFMILFLSY